MRRIILMVMRLILKVPYYLLKIWLCGRGEHLNFNKNYLFVRRVTKSANRAGRVTIESHGIENIPEENGFVLFPNHQGLFDVLVFFESCPVPFAFVIKKEASKIILLKQVMTAVGSLAIDRDDLKQSMSVINQVSEEVRKGRNFLIFAEGTRSREGNKPGDFKGGSFKSAVKAQCPIIPCVLIDSFKPFDERSLQPVTVKVYYMEPIYYEEYKNMKTNEIAALVKKRIEETIEKDFEKNNGNSSAFRLN